MNIHKSKEVFPQEYKGKSNDGEVEDPNAVKGEANGLEVNKDGYFTPHALLIILREAFRQGSEQTWVFVDPNANGNSHK